VLSALIHAFCLHLDLHHRKGFQESQWKRETDDDFELHYLHMEHRWPLKLALQAKKLSMARF
jgi:hypothetical protein